MDKLKLAEQSLVHDDIPEFKAGDTVNVHYRVREGDKERIQQFQGVVVTRKGTGPNQTFTVRKISFGNIGVERIFPLYSPFIAKIEVKKEGAVRRSKLYYLRDLQGKAARIKEKEYFVEAEQETPAKQSDEAPTEKPKPAEEDVEKKAEKATSEEE